MERPLSKLPEGADARPVIHPSHRLPETHEELTRRFAPMVKRFAYQERWLGPDLDDRAQEIWLLLLEQLAHSAFDPARGPLEPYMDLCLRHALLDRKRRARRPMVSMLEHTGEGLFGREPDPTSIRERARFAGLTRAALEAFAAVAAAEAQVIRLRWFGEQPFHAIARALGEAPSTIRTRYCRALARFAAFCGRPPWRELLADWVA